MRFGSVCSGIEAASVAWEPLGWSAAWFSEIEPFPCALLAHRYPTVPNHGDMTTLPARIRAGEVEAPDLFCGGTPCQAFSVAGLRRSLDDDRGNLSLVFCEVASAIDAVRSARGDKPCIVFYENVPGILNTEDNAFGCFLAGLAGETVPLEPAGRKWTDAGVVLGPTRAVAWRVLDAQYFGVAQRRRRVFVVASARDDFDCAAVLFEREGLRRDTAPSREARQVAPTIPVRSTAGGGSNVDFVAHAFHARATDIMQYGDVSGTLDTDAQTIGVVFDTTQITHPANRSVPKAGDPCHPLAAGAHPPAISFERRMVRTSGGQPQVELNHCLRADENTGDGAPCVATVQSVVQVRRLTPRECERLQGFPDDYTAIPYKNKPAADCPDGPRYKALGNSWAVPVVRWIGQRIKEKV